MRHLPAGPLKAVSLFTLATAAIVVAWCWLGAPVPMPPSPLDPGERLYCISYAPFRGSQTPLDFSTKIPAEQIEQDLAELAKVTDCVRTYSVDVGLDQVPEIAQRHGLKVLLGLWVSSHADRTQYQVNTAVAVANRYPDVVRAVIVGNEVLLRGEVSPASLADIIRGVKARVKMPVTYADVWEFWLRYRQLASVVDFVTIHILPYWEDDPVAAEAAADHVESIRRRVADQFPGKEIVIGEVGWPSAGRMRRGALPSPANQARVMADVLERGRREHFRVNVIEAFDQPWKRVLEGTVGGHWGLFDDASRERKFVWGMPVSNHPGWIWQAGIGVLLAALVFATAWRGQGQTPAVAWYAIAIDAAVSGTMLGWTAANVPIESLGAGGWLRELCLAAVSVAAPIACAAALARGVATPSFAAIIGPKPERTEDKLVRVLGWLMIALAVLAIQSALALAFDPRYRDFPFAPLTGAVIPFLLLSLVVPSAGRVRPVAESAAAIVLALAALFVAWNETLTNWQSLWFAAAIAAAGFSLSRARHAPG